jgi:hypothetical protein
MSKTNWKSKFFTPTPGAKVRILPMPEPVIIDHINLIDYNRNDVVNTRRTFDDINKKMIDMLRVIKLEEDERDAYTAEVLTYVSN